MQYYVTDGHGWYCGAAVNNGKRVEFWSRDKADAQAIPIRYVAERVAARQPLAAWVVTAPAATPRHGG